MGLDMYAYIYTGDRVAELAPIEPVAEGTGVQSHSIATWRKHPNLHGWMEARYREKGGEGEFNCVSVELTLADLDKLGLTFASAACRRPAGSSSAPVTVPSSRRTWRSSRARRDRRCRSLLLYKLVVRADR